MTKSTTKQKQANKIKTIKDFEYVFSVIPRTKQERAVWIKNRSTKIIAYCVVRGRDNILNDDSRVISYALLFKDVRTKRVRAFVNNLLMKPGVAAKFIISLSCEKEYDAKMLDKIEFVERL